MSLGVRIRVWGDLALFTRPEMKVERCSYDMITPSAARGILESIYWHPGFVWVIDKICVRNPICFTSIRRNEVKSKVMASKVLSAMNGKEKELLYINSKEEIVQRASILLRNVDYIIDAHFEMTNKANESDNPGKFTDIIRRRLQKGTCYHHPYLGCREFPAKFELFEDSDNSTVYENTEKDLGYMLYDFDYSDPKNIQPLFFRAILKNGVLDLRDCEVIR